MNDVVELQATMAMRGQRGGEGPTKEERYYSYVECYAIFASSSKTDVLLLAPDPGGEQTEDGGGEWTDGAFKWRE